MVQHLYYAFTPPFTGLFAIPLVLFLSTSCRKSTGVPAPGGSATAEISGNWADSLYIDASAPALIKGEMCQTFHSCRVFARC